MTTPESQPPLGSTSERVQREEDRRFASAVAGCVFSQDLDGRAGTLVHVLNTARLLPEDDPRRSVLAMYGQRLLEIVAPVAQQLAEGN
jgi:hypothetical protein